MCKCVWVSDYKSTYMCVLCVVRLLRYTDDNDDRTVCTPTISDWIVLLMLLNQFSTYNAIQPEAFYTHCMLCYAMLCCAMCCCVRFNPDRSMVSHQAAANLNHMHNNNNNNKSNLKLKARKWKLIPYMFAHCG